MWAILAEAATLAGKAAINAIAGGGGSSTPSPPGSLRDYGGDWTHSCPQQYPDDLVGQLLAQIRPEHDAQLGAAYVKARPKAIWSEARQYPHMIAIAGAGGDDCRQGPEEAALQTLLGNLLFTYGLSGTPRVAPVQPTAQVQTTTSSGGWQGFINDVAGRVQDVSRQVETVAGTVRGVTTPEGQAAARAVGAFGQIPWWVWGVLVLAVGGLFWALRRD